MFSPIRFVLVKPSHPGNIGASARAMKTMNLTRLFLVDPKFYPSAEATTRAVGADDVLARAVVCERLAEALVGCGWVAGLSARRRSVLWPELDPRECAQRALKACASTEVALVFGPEHSGLSNDELDLCHYMVHVPANPAFHSLNLAAAVQVMAYELMMASREDVSDDRAHVPAEPVPVDEMERFYAHLKQVLLELAFLNPATPQHLMRRLRRLFNRARLDKNELNILRGILSAIQRQHGSVKVRCLK
jgi:RNA methyltransferase, TrmH family, group 1